jgi:hypothetical protein
MKLEGMNKNLKLFFLFVLLVGVIFRFLLFLMLDNPYHTTDFNTNIVFSVRSFLDGRLHGITGGNWLPLRFYIFGGYFNYLGDDALSARFTVTLFDIATLIFFYLLLRLFFNSEIAIFSTISLAFLAAHVKLSYTSSTDVPSLFFIIFATYCIARIKYKFTFLYYTLGIISLILGSLLRYEVWIFIIILFLYYICDSKIVNLKKGIILLLVTLIFPIYWIIITFINYGSFVPANFYFPMSLIDRIRFTFDVFSLNIGILFTIFSIIGFIYSFSFKKIRQLSIILLLFSIVFCYEWFFKQSLMYWERYLIIFLVFSLPYAYFFILNATKKFAKKFSYYICFLMFIYLILTNINLYSDERQIYPNDFLSVVTWLRANVRSPDSIMVIDDLQISASLKIKADLFKIPYLIIESNQ